MDFKIGIVISTSLWLVTGEQACTSLTDLSEPCGCLLSHDTFDLNCGSDGITYVSMCFLECQKVLNNSELSVAHKGICKPENRCTCKARLKPVCATNGVTYSNECTLNCFMKNDSSIQLDYPGECVSHRPKQITSTPPVNHYSTRKHRCYHTNFRKLRTRFGKNNKRYAPSCDRKREAKQTQSPARLTQPSNQPNNSPFNNPPPLQVLTSSRCPNQPPARQVRKRVRTLTKKCLCVSLYKPVCATNKKSYVNFCVLYCGSKTNPNVKFSHWDICVDSK